jgi:hypothetical protein
MSTYGNSEHGREWALLRADHATRLKAAGLGPLQLKKALAFYPSIHWEGGTVLDGQFVSRALMADMDPIRQAEAVKRIKAAWELVGWNLNANNFKAWSGAMARIVDALKEMRPKGVL